MFTRIQASVRPRIIFAANIEVWHRNLDLANRLSDRGRKEYGVDAPKIST